MKKSLLFLLMLVVTVSLAACATPTKAPSPSPVPTASPTLMVPTETPPPSPTPPVEPTDLPEDGQSPDTNTAAPALSSGDTDQAVLMVERLLDLPEIDSGVVVTMNNLTMAGVTYGEQFKALSTATVQTQVYDVLQTMAGAGASVVVTDDPVLVAQLSTLAARIDNGDRTADVLRSFDLLVRQALS